MFNQERRKFPIGNSWEFTINDIPTEIPKNVEDFPNEIAILPVRRYASEVLPSACLSLSLSVCLSLRLRLSVA